MGGVLSVVDDGAYLPSAEEIAAVCARIRGTWTPEETERRRVRKQPIQPPWTVPVIELPPDIVLGDDAAELHK